MENIYGKDQLFKADYFQLCLIIFTGSLVIPHCKLYFVSFEGSLGYKDII